MILIVGAGLAGLSAAYHLQGIPYKILEREREVGGLCRSYTKDGFTFDYTGHLLHFRQTAIKALVQTLLPTQLQRHARKSFIYSHGTYTEYPFQVNTHGLPAEVVRDCLLGFIATLSNASTNQDITDRSFKQWIMDSLGEGIAKHFMVPFNEKLWQVPLDELTSEWVSWLVPKPDVKDVVNGALGIKDKAFGYNPSFLYPASGGIKVLPEAFLPSIRNLAYDSELVAIETGRRQAVFRSSRGEWTEAYERIVSTIPLPDLARCCVDRSYQQMLGPQPQGSSKTVPLRPINAGGKGSQVDTWSYHRYLRRRKKSPLQSLGAISLRDGHPMRSHPAG